MKKTKGGLLARIIGGYVILGLLGIAGLVLALNDFHDYENVLSKSIKTAADNSALLTDMYNKAHSARIALTVILIAFVVISIVFSIFISSSICKPILTLKKGLIEAEKENDLTVQFNIKSHDDTEEMAIALNHFIRRIRTSMFEVSERSQEIDQSVHNVNDGIHSLNEYLKEITSSACDISSGMEETASSSQEVNATILEVNSAVQHIADKTKAGTNTAMEINARATKLKDNFSESQKNADTVFHTVKESLEKALTDAKEVDRINTLADAILQITSQTKLLSLNASIEAARAGEAGRGFSIVADEIKTLAENSAHTASQIQEVSDIVTQSVSNLAESANSILEFISVTVQNDYSNMLVAANDYEQDASNIENLVSDFSAAASQLSSSFENITAAITGVTTATNDGAQGMSEINTNVQSITEESNKAYSETSAASESAKKLVDAVAKFKM